MKRYSNYTQNKHCKCGKLIDNQSDTCRKCFAKKITGISNNVGKKNGNYVNGNSTKKCYCMDCNKELNSNAYGMKTKRCKSCAQKIKPGILHTILTKNKISKSHIGKHQTEETKKKLRVCNHRHHIDLNRKNNKKTNILKLSNANHGRLHRFGYHYLVETRQIHEYIKWFMNKYRRTYGLSKNLQ